MALNYATSTTIGIGTALNSLGSGSAMQTDAVTTSTTNNVVDAMVRVKINGPATFTASASTCVEVYVWGSEDGATYPGDDDAGEAVTGSAGSITLPANGNQYTYLGAVPLTNTASADSDVYTSKPFSIAAAFGGIMPRKWGLILKNSAGAALAASGHEIKYTEIYYN